MNIKPQNIAKRILTPLGFTLLLLLTVSIFSIYWLQLEHLHHDFESSLEEVDRLLQLKLEEEAKVLESYINLLQMEKKLQTAYMAKDREALLDHAKPFFNSLLDKYQVTHFYFIDLDKTCFLRVHNPPRYGDSIHRITLDDAVQKDVPSYGIELGKFGTFTLRVVYPWRVNGTLIGYLELGKEIDSIAQFIKEIFGVEVILVMNKSYLNRANWEEGMRITGQFVDWTQFPDVVINYSTMQVIPEELIDYFRTPSLFKAKHFTPIFKVSMADRQYPTGFLPMFDAGNREVGHLTVLSDLTEPETALQTLSAIMIIIAVLIGSVLFGIFYFYIESIEGKLVEAYYKLIMSDKKIRKQKDFLQSILDSLNHPFYVINIKDYTIQMANAAANFGKITTKSFCYKLTHHQKQPCDGNEHPCPIVEIKKNKKSFTVEHTHYDKHDNAKIYEVHANPIFDEKGNIKHIAEYTVDITERKRAVEKALQEREAQYYGIFNTVTDALIILDLDGNIVEANRRAYKMYEFYADEFANLSGKYLVQADDYFIFEQFISAIKTIGEFNIEAVGICKSGMPFNVDLRGAAFEYRGKPHLLAIIRNITEHKQMQEKLALAKKAAELANRSKSEFLANLSHELRTPLNGILGFAQILRRDKSLNSQQLDAIHTIAQSGEHLLVLLNDILDMAKVEAGKIELNPADFQLKNFLKSLVDIIQIRAQQKGIDLACEIHQYLPIAVNSDETRLRQVLINLLGNAVKFTDKGQVTFKVSPHSNKIRFQVEDTGHGIAPEDLEKIFQAFQQVGNHKSKAEGTGLGLPLSKKLVEMMGGTLNVKSTLGKGSVFYFDLALPKAEDWQSVDKAPGRSIIGFKGEPCRILVVDDYKINRALLVKLLSSLGFEILEAYNGKEGVEKALAEQPNVILMDLVMPVMSGLEATAKIRQSAKMKDVVIIAASASAFKEDKEKSLSAGCNDFIAKPIKTDELLEKLRQHLKLEWVFDTENPDPKAPEQTEQPLVGPPAQFAKILFQFAMQGNVSSILEQADQLEKNDDKFKPFAEELRKLAKGFQVRKLRELIKPYLN